MSLNDYPCSSKQGIRREAMQDKWWLEGGEVEHIWRKIE